MYLYVSCSCAFLFKSIKKKKKNPESSRTTSFVSNSEKYYVKVHFL